MRNLPTRSVLYAKHWHGYYHDFVSNTRLAPIQAVALGHPATTHSEFIDYVIVEDDYVGSEDCLAKPFYAYPKMPYLMYLLHSPHKSGLCTQRKP